VSDIHYFPRYSQRENVITNNTLLLLARLYDYSRPKFRTFMGSLCGTEPDAAISLGLQFKQQRGTGKTVADGFIAQESVKIVVETKQSEGAFYLGQLQGHLAAFGQEDHRLLVLLSPSEAIEQGLLRQIREAARARGVTVLPTSFERIIGAALGTLADHEEEMRALVEDYAVFCSEEGLLPRDGYRMFVIPCGTSLEDNFAYRLYYCPADRTVRNARYLGIYADKAVRYVGTIAKVAECEVDLETSTARAVNASPALTNDEQKRVVEASRSARDNHGWDTCKAHRFFLCDELLETEFTKTSPGGIMNRRYFDLGDVLTAEPPASLKELATLLRQRTWE
jgi:hypothetical protein